MNAVIEVKHLTKDFKDVKAVNDLSFSVESGQVYGFLGQNGAGKSTTIRMLLTLIKPSSGDIEIFGMNLLKHRNEILRQVGAIIERPDLYKYLTALENLRIFAAMSGVKVSEKALMDQLAMVGLAERAHSKVKTYSQGMKQRLGIATALVHDPKLIILDEPTNGLDPQGIADIRNLILHLSKEMNKTLLISSHLLSEMELIADSMIIIDKGKKVVEGKVNELFDPAETVVELKTTDDAATYEKLQQSALKNMVQGKRNDCILLKLHRDEIPAVMKELVQMDIEVLSFYSKHSLEDYFLSLTAHPHVETLKN
ncbi:MAG: ABC transporter ATP-binding protein [Chitinophagaceae bacterium]|jgi:ABC-type multidrug transport system ATPase subunit|nr:ABC transporter ATP-binding protein [Chitinophagaceae bacterium]MBK9464166.1 ABC transporter ATP-binding protein [Chitinophagaceae bacterium]MBK9658711.1 ABC transporter ATP-binding protein [Chitinophagaceae bacterium]